MKEQADLEGIKYEKELLLYNAKTDYLGQRKTISLTYDRAM